MSNKSKLKPIAAALGATFVVSMAASPMANAAENPFQLNELSSGYMVAEGEGACGEGKCGDKGAEEGACGEKGAEEGKCGEGKCGDKDAEGACGEKGAEEGKCGEGKCGDK